MKNERKTNHAFCCLPRAIFDFVRFSSQGPKSSTMRGLLAFYVGPRCVHVFKKNTLTFYFSATLSLRSTKKIRKKETKGIKFKRGGFDKID